MCPQMNWESGEMLRNLFTDHFSDEMLLRMYMRVPLLSYQEMMMIVLILL